jgi:hypothetical protein
MEGKHSIIGTKSPALWSFVVLGFAYFCLFWGYWGLNSGLHGCYVGALLPESFFALVVFQVGSCLFSAGLSLAEILLPVPVE